MNLGWLVLSLQQKCKVPAIGYADDGTTDTFGVDDTIYGATIYQL